MRTKPKLLYVDDEPLNLMLFNLNFRKRFDVITAESGYIGLEILKFNDGMDVVISDMKMPGMSGTDFIRAAKRDYPDVPYFILTGFDITDEIAMALKEGLIHKYFRKPFNMRDMEESINKVLK